SMWSSSTRSRAAPTARPTTPGPATRPCRTSVRSPGFCPNERASPFGIWVGFGRMRTIVRVLPRLVLVGVAGGALLVLAGRAQEAHAQASDPPAAPAWPSVPSADLPPVTTPPPTTPPAPAPPPVPEAPSPPTVSSPPAVPVPTPTAPAT